MAATKSVAVATWMKRARWLRRRHTTVALYCLLVAPRVERWLRKRGGEGGGRAAAKARPHAEHVAAVASVGNKGGGGSGGGGEGRRLAVAVRDTQRRERSGGGGAGGERAVGGWLPMRSGMTRTASSAVVANVGERVWQRRRCPSGSGVSRTIQQWRFGVGKHVLPCRRRLNTFPPLEWWQLNAFALGWWRLNALSPLGRW